MNEIHSIHLQAGELRMHALVCGDEKAPPVVLLHGFPELSESWREILPILAQAGFRAIAPDLRGYGGTDRPQSGYDLDTLAQDVANLIAAISPDGAAHLVGHDWGGAIAYHTAALHPGRVRRLAVVNCPHPAVMAERVWRPAQLRRSWYMFFFQLPFVPEYLLSRNEGALVPKLLRGAAVDRSRFSDEKLAPYAKAFSRPEAVRAAVAYYRTMFRDILRREQRYRLRHYPPIRAPFQLIWGTEDVALGLDLTRGLEPWFTHPPEVRYLEGVGHFATIEAPEKVGGLLVEHLGTEQRGESASASA